MNHLICFESFSKIIKIGSRGTEVKQLQENLEKAGFELSKFGIDSIFGFETLGATRAFLNKAKEEKNDLVKNNENLFEIKNNQVTIEQLNLIEEIANDGKFLDKVKTSLASFVKGFSNNTSEVMAQEELYKRIPNTEEFIAKLNNICEKLEIQPNWLIWVMWKESKFSSKIQNRLTNATGLIQFMPSTLKGMGYEVDHVKNMSAIDQLDLVYKYYLPYKGRIHSVGDLYMATFYPVALNKDDDFIMGSESSDQYAKKVANQNKVVDLNRDKKITKKEFGEYVMNDIPQKWKGMV